MADQLLIKHQRMTPVVDYSLSEIAWRNHKHYLRQLIISVGAKRILDVGGGANPCLSLDEVWESSLEYVVADISATELEKADSRYNKVVTDIMNVEEGCARPGYDLLFSRMLAEHVISGQRFHTNCSRLLRPGGVAFHFFPTLYALPFVVNRIIPENLTRFMLARLQTGREPEGRHGKFPAYYSWCRGPSKRQIRRFQSIGYRVVNYIGFFGHAGYYGAVPMLAKLHRWKVAWLLRHPYPAFTSYAYVVLEKREQTS